MTAFTDLHARLEHSDRGMWLGRLVTYGVPMETKLTHEALCRLLVECNLASFLPKPPADSDAFRRVCTEPNATGSPPTTHRCSTTTSCARSTSPGRFPCGSSGNG